MKAMVLRERGPMGPVRLKLEELPEPAPGQGEVRVRISACGVCRTDLHVAEGDLPAGRTPLVPGHQAVGVVDELGPGASRLRLGQRVGLAWLYSTCGACQECGTGRENLCENARFTGHLENGGFAESAVAPESFLYAIPEAFDDVQAAPLLCAGIIGYRALRRSNVPPAGRLGIFGFGSSAHVTIQVAAHWGCEVFVFSRNARHQEQARRLGASWAGSAKDHPPGLVDGAILFAPVGDLVPPAMRALKKGGTLAVAGVHMTDIPAMEYEPHLFYEKTLTSVTANTRADGEALLRDAAAIPIRAAVREYPLADANRALMDLKSGRIDGTAVLRIGA